MSNNLNNKKVGILTLYHDNYNFGGLLQAYALPIALKIHFGIHAEQIDYIPQWSAPESSKGLYHLCCKIAALLYQPILHKRQKAFEKFIQSIPHSEKIYTMDTIQKSCSAYQTFLCGGDQIWNPILVGRNLEVFTLQFAPSDKKKIAYSPSIAVPELSAEAENAFRAGLNAFHAVSIREKQSVSLLQNLIEKKIEVVVDPVLLLTAQEWRQTLQISPQKGNYILCYLLGDNADQRKAIQKCAQNLHLPTTNFSHILCNTVRKCDLFFGDTHDHTSGPREFVELIQNAAYVITDSFHACVFSMIFETPFAALERNASNATGNMNSRIHDFLEEYHLNNQLISTNKLSELTEIPQVDFTFAQEHWKKRRNESLAYLENALKEDEIT